MYLHTNCYTIEQYGATICVRAVVVAAVAQVIVRPCPSES